MMDVGWGELLVLGVLALLIFGPDKLPKAAADAGRMVKRLREMAQSAQNDLKESGIDVSGVTLDIKSVVDLHPKRIVSSTVADVRNAGSGVTATSASTQSGSSGTAPSQSSTPRIDPDAT